MIFAHLASSDVLQVRRFTDFDEFQPSLVLGEARSTPLELKDFSVARGVLDLPTCTLVLQRNFPRLLETFYRPNPLAMIVPMGDDIGARLNGLDLSSDSILAIRDAIECHFLETQRNLCTIVHFKTLPPHGWYGHDALELMHVARPEMARLKHLLAELFVTAAKDGARLSDPALLAAMEDSVFSALDAVMMAADTVEWPHPDAFNRYKAVVSRVDELFSADPTNRLSSASVASACGVSVRTLHNAMISARGVSLQQYLRTKRLWAVRNHLAIGSAGLTVKKAASRQGFWHFGEFVASYRALFGETPSQTLMRARGVISH